MITTNLMNESYAVLMDEEGRVVAIIKCPQHGDITEQVKEAIADDVIGHDVVIESRHVVSSLDNTNFQATFKDDNEWDCKREFSLTTATVY